MHRHAHGSFLQAQLSRGVWVRPFAGGEEDSQLVELPASPLSHALGAKVGCSASQFLAAGDAAAARVQTEDFS